MHADVHCIEDSSHEDNSNIDRLPGLEPKLRAALETSQVCRLFQVQANTWKHTGGGLSFDRDLCVSAPTGSGKTLAYAIPIVQALCRQSQLSQLRSLVIVPTGDLAAQVGHVFKPLCRAVGLKVSIAQRSEVRLLQCNAALNEQNGLRHLPALKQKVFTSLTSQTTVAHPTSTDVKIDIRDVDILVTPPGRLVALVRQFARMFLDRIEFLVIDEADRILRQTYQGWLPLVISTVMARSLQTTLGDRGASRRRLKKLLFSATLTRDPSRLAGLHLQAPYRISAEVSPAIGGNSYILPLGLEEYVITSRGELKPLALCALLKRIGQTPTIVFTSSVETTRNLFRLLHAMTGLPSRPVEYSSYAPLSRRTESLQLFRSGRRSLLIASDAATRGLDIENVAVIISYDVPEHPKTYIHRVGRTARAQRRGFAYTICRPTEEKRFHEMLANIGVRLGGNVPQQLSIIDEEVRIFSRHMKQAMSAMKLKLSARQTNLSGTSHTGLLQFEPEVVRVAADQASHNFREALQEDV